MNIVELFLLGLFYLSLVSGQCPSGYVHFASSNKCYRLVKEAASWDNARTQCRAQGGDLAVPTSQAENDYLKQMNGKLISCSKFLSFGSLK